MSIPPKIVASARMGWRWQWNQLMNGLAPADKEGNYFRPPSQVQNSIVPNKDDLLKSPPDELPVLVIGRSCPWAHRTWLIYELRNLKPNLNLLIAKADHQEGLWKIEPTWMACTTLMDIYKLCNIPPRNRATVPALIDPKKLPGRKPKLLGNESAQLVETMNSWQ